MNFYETLRYTILDLETRQFQFMHIQSDLSRDVLQILRGTLNQLYKIEYNSEYEWED